MLNIRRFFSILLFVSSSRLPLVCIFEHNYLLLRLSWSLPCLFFCLLYLSRIADFHFLISSFVPFLISSNTRKNNKELNKHPCSSSRRVFFFLGSSLCNQLRMHYFRTLPLLCRRTMSFLLLFSIAWSRYLPFSSGRKLFLCSTFMYANLFLFN